MIVCSCNVLTDATIKATLAGSAGQACPRTPGAVYKCLGCSPNCGRCIKTVRKIIRDALGDAPSACVDEACQPQDLPVCELETLTVTEEQVFFPIVP
ncbi:MAG: (2Fe-2S)-binding protein [Methylocella sp.]